MTSKLNHLRIHKNNRWSITRGLLRSLALVVLITLCVISMMSFRPSSAWAQVAEEPVPTTQEMTIAPNVQSAGKIPKAFTQEEVDLKFNGNLRMRYLNLTRPTGDTDTFEASQGFFEQRTLLGLSLRRGEPIGGYVSVVNSTRWGRANDTDNNGTAAQAAVGNSAPGVNNGTGNSNNMVLVNEAWAWWKATDSISLKLGRQAFTLGDETVFSKNEFEQFPVSLDGAVLNWDFDDMTVSTFGFKLEEYARPSIGGSDPEHNLYGAAFDAKETRDWIKMLHGHLLQSVSQQSGTTGDGGINELGQNIQRGGIAIKVGTLSWDLRLSSALMNGQLKDRSNINSSNTNVQAYMYDVETGYMLRDFYKIRIYAGYHFDTGDRDFQNRNTGDAVSGSDRQWNRYSGLFFNRHKYAGLMDVIDWGNINYVTAGTSATPFENTKILVQWLVFQRSTPQDRITPGTRGAYMLGNGNTYQPGNPDALEVGHEIETQVEYELDNGFTSQLIAGVFTPGKYLQDGRTPTNGPIKQSYWQVLLMASYQF